MTTPDPISVDPWNKARANNGPVPEGAQFACAHTVSISIDCFDEELWFLRTETGDELWNRSSFAEGRVVEAPSKGSPARAALRLVDVLIRSRVGFGFPREFLRPGLVTAQQFDQLVLDIESELDRNRQAAEAQEAEIIDVARELGLGPEPTGTGPNNWRARCPGTNHSIMISASSNSFGCGYCRVKGGPGELREFAAARRERGRH